MVIARSDGALCRVCKTPLGDHVTHTMQGAVHPDCYLTAENPMTTPESQQAALLPCPFCGDTPIAHEVRDSDETGESWGYSAVECQKCSGGGKDGRFCGVHGETPEKAAKAWNTRAPAPVEVSHAALAEFVQQRIDREFYAEADIPKYRQIVAALRAHPAGGVSEDVAEVIAGLEKLSKRWPEQVLPRAIAHLRAAGIGAGVVPEDVVRLVLAARAVAFDIVPDLVRSSPASPQIKNGALVLIKSLDRASEAFAERVPWVDEPDDEKAAASPSHEKVQ